MLPQTKMDDNGLADKLKEASNRPMTKEERQEERREQIVSFVFSGRGKNDHRTKDDIRRSLEEQGLI